MGSFTSDYLKTRLKVLSRRLISIEQLKEMVEMDLNQLLKQIQISTGHRYNVDKSNLVSLESQMAKNALNDFQILIRPFSGTERRFFYYALHWFELINLKVLIRGKFSATKNSVLQRQLVDLGTFSNLPLNKLMEAEDPLEMLRLLEKTIYSDIVRQARRMFEEHGNDLFLLDATIDRRFFIDLRNRLQVLHKDDVDSVGKVIGSLLDRFNLLWLLRYRFSFGLSPAKSFYLLTASGRKLHSANLMRLAKKDSIEEVINELPDEYKKQLVGLKEIYQIENMMEYMIISIASKSLAHNKNIVAKTFSYILLREAQVRFLQALIKGKKLGFQSDLIRLAVVGGF